ncbi:MAG: Na+/H+ antiporter subunit D [candidate division KSB1 bacterium]|nr:Na+/H+ antiporter subunit D [candidate division KSB1 bacterium]
MIILIVLPILIPLLTAAVSILAWKSRRVQRGLGLVGTAALLVAGLQLLRVVQQEGIQAARMGNWPAPFGITLVADLFSAIMVVLAGLMGFAVAIYSLVNVDKPRESFGYYPLLHILLMGVCGAFITGDIFNLYVWFEVMLIASFVLLALGGERAQLEGAIKYVTLNLISSAIFLAAVGILYGAAGTLNMADLAHQLNAVQHFGLVTTLAMLFLVAFGIKAAVFPLFFWLPASYHTPPVAVSAIFAGLLTKVGVYALIRVFTLLFVQDVSFTHNLILIIAGLTMVTGVLGAAAQNEIRRILSFHIVSQIGYMIMGLGLFSPLAIAGSVFYIAHHIIVKTNLFLIGGLVHRLQGTSQLKESGGLYRRHPLVAILFLIPALSLAGIPPLSGFWAKLTLVQAGLELKQYAIVITSLAVSLLTLFSMNKIWTEAFWKKKPEPSQGVSAPTAQPLSFGVALLYHIPIVMLALLTLAIGLSAEPIFVLAQQAAAQLLDPAAYIEAVLTSSK